MMPNSEPDTSYSLKEDADTTPNYCLEGNVSLDNAFGALANEPAAPHSLLDTQNRYPKPGPSHYPGLRICQQLQEDCFST